MAATIIVIIKVSKPEAFCYDDVMNLIRTITEEDFGRTASPNNWDDLKERVAARAILSDSENRIALMHVSNLDYYKLPGGGVDEGESIEDALRRELEEEAGAKHVEIHDEIGVIHEMREQMKKKSIHHCYLVQLMGELEDAKQTDKEVEDGYQIVWAKNLDEAIQLVESGQPPDYGPCFERLRELTFLKYLKSS